MANPLRGEVELVAGGSSYTLRLATNALIEAETLLDRGVGEIAELLRDASSFRLGTARALLFAGLREHHPQVTLEGAGEIIGLVGIPGIVEALGRSMAAAFPTPEEAPQKRQETNPRQAGPNGTGRRSRPTSSRSASSQASSGH